MADNLISASSPQFMIQKNLQDLVLHHLPPNAAEDKLSGLMRYGMRILGSRMSAAPLAAADADHIKQILLRQGKHSLS